MPTVLCTMHLVHSCASEFRGPSGRSHTRSGKSTSRGMSVAAVGAVQVHESKCGRSESGGRCAGRACVSALDWGRTKARPVVAQPRSADVPSCGK